MSERDDVSAVLGELVLYLLAKRDAGSKEAHTLREQRLHREGYTGAIKGVASSRVLLSMLPAEARDQLTG